MKAWNGIVKSGLDGAVIPTRTYAFDTVTVAVSGISRQYGNGKQRTLKAFEQFPGQYLGRFI